MIQCAVELSTSQTTLENEYYMVDLPLILDEKRKSDASRALLDVSIVSILHMDEDSRKQLIESLRSQAGIVEDVADGPDLEGLAKLKSMLSRK